MVFPETKLDKKKYPHWPHRPPGGSLQARVQELVLALELLTLDIKNNYMVLCVSAPLLEIIKTLG